MMEPSVPTRWQPSAWHLLLLGVLSALSVLLSACGGTSSEVRQVDIKQLWQSPSGYQEKVVRTSGIVRDAAESAAEPHFLLASTDGQYSVSLLSSSSDLVRELEGRGVEVTGRFDVLRDVGGAIEVQSISPLPPPGK